MPAMRERGWGECFLPFPAQRQVEGRELVGTDALITMLAHAGRKVNIRVKSSVAA